MAFCWSNFVCCQIDTLSVINETKKYVKFIDSLNKLDDVQSIGFSKSIADGVFKKGKRVIGGSGLYTLSDYQDDSVFRIMYHDNLGVNIYKTYYYKQNKLVYSALRLQSADGKYQTLYEKEEIYFNDVIIFSEIRKNPTAIKYVNKTDFSLFEDGLKYLNKFHEKNNRR